MKRLVAVAGALALLASGCGGPDAKKVLHDTAASLATIHSGTLRARLMVTPRHIGANRPFGFELHGPFSFRSGQVPALDVSYRQVTSGKEDTVTLVTKGGSGYVDSHGKRIALTSAQLAQLRAAVTGVGGGGAARVVADRWLRHPKAEADGNDYRVTGDLDAVTATVDLLSLARLSNPKAPRLDAADRKRLDDAVESTHFELVTGKEDKLLRDLQMEIDFALDVPKSLKSALGDLVGAKIDFRLAVEHPNGKG